MPGESKYKTRRRYSHGVNGAVVWEKTGAKAYDWEARYYDDESDGMSPYERRRYLDRHRN